jgi:superfamily II DNA/RNA helicase
LLKLNELIVKGERDKPKNNEIVALILAPSRELAIQIFKVLAEFKDLIPEIFQMCYLIGGSKIEYDL